ncbi:glycosyltransferase [Cellulomonas sp. ATA003]|uniref:glycosyltransferase family protein n=1 Tax=Cellulomonas sp. ATA003 TaxID=3073064 RepID=UPI0028736E62|nr:glycosyltransferase [Cellulomonas sp. ATA003]WNB85445.1 glycosyltransferase [Cellulomonas sp. ATA003]
MLYVGVFADDEPVDEVVDAAALLPEVDFAITGDLARCPAALRNRAPANVEFVGFLGPDAYAAEFGRAHAIMSLTTEPTSIMRSAYEAVYARRPLVTSEWPSLQQVFPLAHHAANVAPALADAVRTALQDDAARLDKALALQSARWFDQLTRLQAALSR